MPVLSNTPEYSYRIVVLGDYAVGKSSIALQYVKSEFNTHEESTIGAAFLAKTILIAGSYIKYEIWDTAGQERYNSLIPMYYRGAHGALVVYDITSNKSFERAQAWIKELSIEKPSNFLKVLVGNKVDLEERREVACEAAQEYAQQHGLLFYETSAKEGINIESIFNDMAAVLPKNTVDREHAIDFSRKNRSFGCC